MLGQNLQMKDLSTHGRCEQIKALWDELYALNQKFQNTGNYTSTGSLGMRLYLNTSINSFTEENTAAITTLRSKQNCRLKLAVRRPAAVGTGPDAEVLHVLRRFQVLSIVVCLLTDLSVCSITLR